MRILRSTDDPEPSLRTQLKTANKPLKTSLYSLLLLLGIISTSTHAAGSLNLGLASNYLWRGISQSNDNIALSGGYDYNTETGAYFGTWASTLSSGSYELDLYAGISKSINNANYDVGIISYQYPNDDDYFNELYFKFEYGIIQTAIAYTFSSKDNTGAEFSQGDWYYSIGSSKTFDNEIGISATLGHYDYDDPLGDDYSHLNVALSKNHFTLAVDKSTGLTNNNDLIASIAWSQSFNL